VIKRDYLMADETPIDVLTENKPGATHKGYHRVYYSPDERLVLFDYRKGRGREGPEELLKGYRGALQADGYSAYESFEHKPDITLPAMISIQLACWLSMRDMSVRRGSFHRITRHIQAGWMEI
jgi:hypothetical protein